MNDPEVRFNEMISALKGREFRLTPQRVELVRLIAVSEGHPNVSQIHAKIKRQFPTMSLATVYKTIALLKDMNQVLEIGLHKDSHYDGNRPQPHPHLICVNCNQIIDAEVSLDRESRRILEQTSGFKILRLHVTLHGLCPDCREDG